MFYVRLRERQENIMERIPNIFLLKYIKNIFLSEDPKMFKNTSCFYIIEIAIFF
jgi:hypothetical protein